MNTKKFSEAMNEVDSRYVGEAIAYGKKGTRRPAWIKLGAAAACLCAVISGGVLLYQNGGGAAPNPSFVEISNPILSVESPAEMEEYLDFKVPVLDKEIEACSVLLTDGYPTLGQINYADGSEFRIQYGSGDISGIYGAAFAAEKKIGGVQVEYYEYDGGAYAIWEQDGFSFSYVSSGSDVAAVETLIQRFR